jgi:transcriptional regulator with XRE-family HTH domain
MAVRTSDGRAKTAKAAIRKPDYADLGGCIEHVRNAFGLTLEAFAYELKVNDRQLARQIKGDDRPQLEKVFAVERFQGPLVIALAKLAAGVEVDTVIHVRRTA